MHSKQCSDETYIWNIAPTYKYIFYFFLCGYGTKVASAVIEFAELQKLIPVTQASL